MCLTYIRDFARVVPRSRIELLISLRKSDDFTTCPTGHFFM